MPRVESLRLGDATQWGGGRRETGNVGGPTFRSLGGEQAAEMAVKLLP